MTDIRKEYAMENESIACAVETLAKSMADTQKNATDTKGPVEQVLSLAGKDMHDKTVVAILEDHDLCMAEKLSLIHCENADYDRRQGANAERVARLQDVNTHNVGRATGWWSENWVWVVFACITGIAVGTPQGRRLLASTASSLAA